MKRRFEEEIKKLNLNILKMATLAEEAILKSVKALENSDIVIAQQVIDNDEKIDKKELEIEEACIMLLALQQPVAKDFRFITTGMRINTELERIADLAVNIAYRVLEIVKKGSMKTQNLSDIFNLADMSRSMVKDVIDSFVNRDEKISEKVILFDSEVDKLRNKIIDFLINEIVKDGILALKIIPLILVVRHLERICDHATYIAEDIIYMIQAKVIKHNTEKLMSE